MVKTPCCLKSSTRTFQRRGGGRRSSNVPGGKQSRMDGADGTSLHGAKRRKIGRRPRSSAVGLSLTARGFSPDKSSKRISAEGDHFRPRAAAAQGGGKGALLVASATAAKRSLGTPGRRGRCAHRTLKDCIYPWQQMYVYQTESPVKPGLYVQK